MQPLVSICSLTYNHAPYIRQCLDGFLMQKTNFAFEVLINDDCSTDGTTEILKEYAERYPDIIIPVYHEENLYSKGMRGFYGRFLYPRARGKYIALCVGDDYWTDPLKLQKQVDFLEANPEYGLVYGKARQYDQTQGKFRPGTIGAPLTDFTDLVIKGNLIPTATALFRNELCKKYYEEDFPRDSWKMGDYPLWLYVALHGRLYFIDSEMAVYRLLEQSASARHSFSSRESFIVSANKMRSYFVERFFPELLVYNESRSVAVLFENAFVYNQVPQAKAYFRQMKSPSIKNRLRFLILTLTPLNKLYRTFIC